MPMPIPLCVNPRSSTSVSRRRPIIEPTDLPTVSRLRSSFGRADFADAFSVELPQAACGNAEALARHVFEQQPGWIAKLLRIRDRLVQPIGLKRVADLRSGEGERISIFRVFERYPYEIILALLWQKCDLWDSLFGGCVIHEEPALTEAGDGRGLAGRSRALA